MHKYKRITITMYPDQYERVKQMSIKLGLPLSRTMMLAFSEFEAIKRFQDDPQKIKDIMLDLQNHLDLMKK